MEEVREIEDTNIRSTPNLLADLFGIYVLDASAEGITFRFPISIPILIGI